MKTAVDPFKAIQAGKVMLTVTAAALALIIGGYAALLLTYREALWALPTYDSAKAMPGGVDTWIMAALIAAFLLVIGIISKREHLIGVGSTISSVWLFFFAFSFGMDAYHDPTPVALPGVVIYSGLALMAAARVGASAALRRTDA